MDNEEKTEVLTQNVIKYVNQRKDSLIFKNYFFLLKQSNKTKPCPDKELEFIHVLINKDISVELSLGTLNTYDYLNIDENNGEIETYGLSFYVDNNSGNIEGCYAYISFVKWSNDKIGERQSLGGEVIEYKEKIPNIEEKYLNKNKLKELNDFFENEMKIKQINNKNKCN